MNLPDYPLAFYPVAVIAILLTGISKGGFAGGVGGIAVPLLSLYLTPQDAAGIMLPILCLMDLFGLGAYRGRWSREHLRALLPGGVVGIGLGAMVFGMVSAAGVKLLVGLIAVVFSLNRWLDLTGRLARTAATPGAIAGGFWGAMSGFTSTLAHAGGPPFAVYLLPQGLDRTTFVGTSVVFFTVVNYVKIIPYGMLGQLDGRNLATALVFLPLAPIGIWAGVWLHRRIPEALFYQIAYVFLFLTGSKLVYDGIAG